MEQMQQPLHGLNKWKNEHPGLSAALSAGLGALGQGGGMMGMMGGGPTLAFGLPGLLAEIGSAAFAPVQQNQHSMSLMDEYYGKRKKRNPMMEDSQGVGV